MCVCVCVYECGVVYFKRTFIQQTSIDLEKFAIYNPLNQLKLLFTPVITALIARNEVCSGWAHFISSDDWQGIGKGLGKGGAKRHRKVLRDNIQVIISVYANMVDGLIW